MNWMTDVQKGLAWALILVFAILVLLFTVFSAVGHLPDSILDVFKQVVTALINVVMVVIGFFFGSSQGSKDKDAAANAVLQTLASGASGGSAAAAEKAAPPAAAIAAPPAAEAAVAEVIAREEANQNPYTVHPPNP
jgi:hypothetical protein